METISADGNCKRVHSPDISPEDASRQFEELRRTSNAKHQADKELAFLSAANDPLTTWMHAEILVALLADLDGIERGVRIDAAGRLPGIYSCDLGPAVEHFKAEKVGR